MVGDRHHILPLLIIIKPGREHIRVSGEREMSFTVLAAVSTTHLTLLGSGSTNQVLTKKQHEALYVVVIA